MHELSPPALTPAAYPAMQDGLRALLGRRLSRVTYASSPGAFCEPDPAHPTIETVDMAVLFRFEGRSLRLDWAAHGDVEGVAVTLESGLPESWERRRVERDSQWVQLVRQSLAGLTIVWSGDSDHAATTAAGLVMEFSGGSQVAVALGEVEDGALRYLPTELVAIFDEARAAEYLQSLRGPNDEPVTYQIVSDDLSPSHLDPQ